MTNTAYPRIRCKYWRYLMGTCLATVGIAGIMPGMAHAQLEQIVVTAQRREERMQDVPITLHAISGEAMRIADIRTVEDLTTVVPGFRAHIQTHYFQPFIRGVGGTSTLPGNEAAVATYIDDIYVGYKFSNTFEMDNIERIEVLKGPQGTLFGRNATGGAVNIITRAPTSEFGARAQATYGRFDQKIISTTLSGPVSDTLGVIASVRYEDFGPYMEDIYDGSIVGTKESFQGMAKVLWTPSDDFRLTAEVIHTDRDINDDPVGTVNPAHTPRGSTVPGAVIATIPYQLSNESDARHSLDDQKYILDMRYDAGSVSLASITGYIDSDSANSTARDRNSAPITVARAMEFSRQVTQEFQVSSNSWDKFNWITGLYYFRTKEGYKDPGFEVLSNVPDEGTIAALASVFGVPGASMTRGVGRQIATSWAGFAEANYQLTKKTRVTAGLRYTWEKRDWEGERYAVTAPPPGNAYVLSLLSTADLDASFDRLTYRIVLDHKITPDIMLFASYNTGFRSGAYNPTDFTPTQEPLQPELIDAFEVGIKSEWLHQRLRVNASGFYYDYTDLHVAIRSPGSGTIVQQNAGSARVYGFDLEVLARPTSRLSLSGGINILNAEYKKFLNASTFVPDLVNGGGARATILDAKGYALNFSPDFTANLAASYSIPLPGDSELVVEGNYFYTSSFHRQVGETPEVDSHDNLNASITWYNPNRSMFVRAWGRNLTNQKVLGSQLDTFALFYIVQRPVTYGVTLGFCFGAGSC